MATAAFLERERCASNSDGTEIDSNQWATSDHCTFGARMARYAAFLRGINVGGHHRVPMPQLRDTFSSLGCENVRTVLATGNVLFESRDRGVKTLRAKIRNKLNKTFGFDIPVILLPGGAIDQMIAADPFGKLKSKTGLQLYVTFLGAGVKPRLPKLPYTAPDGSFQILHASKDAVFATVNRNSAKTPEYMKFLEKHCGTDITTRNWNTMLKLID